MKIEILFHYIFQEKNLDDILKAKGKEEQLMLCLPSLLGTLDQCPLFSLPLHPCTANAPSGRGDNVTNCALPHEFRDDKAAPTAASSSLGRGVK